MEPLEPPLPVAWYFDESILRQERGAFFQGRPTYLGCLPMMSEPGSYRTVAPLGHASAIVRSTDGIRLISNLCRHRSSILLQGQGKVRSITCAIHGWKYDLEGKLIAAPRYPALPDCSLDATQTQVWNGLIFSQGELPLGRVELLRDHPKLDVSDYVVAASEEEVQKVNWKIPIEVLLENYHAPLLHPGFARYVDPATWYQNEGTIDTDKIMLQEMKPSPNFSLNKGSKTFEEWQRAILTCNGGVVPARVALIVLLLPDTILEWWPFMFVCTTYTPIHVGDTLMQRDFLFDNAALDVVPGYSELAMAAWYETQVADDRAHEALQEGRRLLFERHPAARSGFEEYQNPMEESVRLFHQLLMRGLSRASGT